MQAKPEIVASSSFISQLKKKAIYVIAANHIVSVNTSHGCIAANHRSCVLLFYFV